MRKRKYLIAMAGVTAVSVVAAGSAFGGGSLQGQTTTVVVSSKPQDKKLPGPVSSLTVNVDTQYSIDGNAQSPFVGKALNTKVEFPKDFTFTPPKPQCDPAVIQNTTTEAALAACGPAQVGTGRADIITPANTAIGAVVTAFNGTPNGGLPVVLLHSRTTANTTTVLIGTLRTSDQGPQFGKQLDVIVPTLPLGAVITHFETTIPQLVTVKGKKAKKGKKAVPAKYYIGAKCSTKKWDFRVRSFYNNGASTSADASLACKQKASKKPKK